MKEIYCCILNCRFSNEITLLERMHLGRFEESGQRSMEIHGTFQNSSKLILFEIIQVEINHSSNYLRKTTKPQTLSICIHYNLCLFFLSAANSREELTARNPIASRDGKKLLNDILGDNNLTYPNFISKVETADEILDVRDKPSVVTPQQYDSSFPQAGREQKGFGATTLNQCSNEVLISHCTQDIAGCLSFTSEHAICCDIKMTFTIGPEERLRFEGGAFECIYSFRAANDGLITQEARAYVIVIEYVFLLVI
jgi:hypothetical protein